MYNNNMETTSTSWIETVPATTYKIKTKWDKGSRRRINHQQRHQQQKKKLVAVVTSLSLHFQTNGHYSFPHQQRAPYAKRKIKIYFSIAASVDAVHFLFLSLLELSFCVFFVRKCIVANWLLLCQYDIVVDANGLDAKYLKYFVNNFFWMHTKSTHTF